MEKNYYDILQINKNASPEIVEKAYKTLVRMYHPDLQEEENKQEYEEKLKLINEAYEVLSDEEKRIKYDLELEEKDNINKQNINLNNNVQSDNNYTSTNNNVIHNQSKQQNYEQPVYQDINEKIRQARQQAEYERQYNEQINNAINKAYHDAYIQDLKNRGYKIKYKKTFRDYVTNFITIIIVIFILFLLFQIPFIKNYFINLYNENEIFHYIIDLFFNLFRK